MLDAIDAWNEYVKKNGIKNPWKLFEEFRDKIGMKWKEEVTKNGITISYKTVCGRNEWDDDVKKEYDELLEYRDQYLIDKEIWMGEYILKMFGYEKLKEFAAQHKSKEKYDMKFHEWMATIYPCEGKERQCNMNCPVFNKCPYEEQGIYRSGGTKR